MTPVRMASKESSNHAIQTDHTKEVMMKLSAQQINVAIDWWGNWLRTKDIRHQVMSRGERGDPGSRDVMWGETVASVLHPKCSEDQIDAFKTALAKHLQNADVSIYCAYLHVDYHPSQPLIDALEVAGIDERTSIPFPLKTYMVFTDGGVEVACGYQQPYREVYNEDR